MKIKVLNWVEYNPRKDLKSMPWFRLNSDIGYSEKLFGLPNEAKWFWIFILSTCARKTNGEISINFNYTSYHSGVSEKNIKKYLELFENKGLLQITNGSDLISTDTIENVPNEQTNRHNEQVVLGRESINNLYTKNHVEKNDLEYNAKHMKNNPIAIKQLFRELCVGKGRISDNSMFVSPCTIENMKILFGYPDFQENQQWIKYFENISKNSFLNGTEKDFVITFDWIMKPDNASKVLNGAYSSKKESDDNLIKQLAQQAVLD